MKDRRVLVWFSCGAASAVAAKKTLWRYPDAEILYCDTLKYEHPDNRRFMDDVSKWLGKEIKILKSDKYEDIYDVYDRTGWLVGPGGARCTTELKKNVRKAYQREGDVHVIGYTAEEQKRMDQIEESEWDVDFWWVLKEHKITKKDCYRILQDECIELPMMYKLGYNNNNCIGCVKGQQGYWNKIRVDFPEMFEKMAKQERKMNVAINKTYAGDGKRKRVFLDELDPKAGRGVKEPDIDCGVMCVYNPDNREEAEEQLEMRLSAESVKLGSHN